MAKKKASPAKSAGKAGAAKVKSAPKSKPKPAGKKSRSLNAPGAQAKPTRGAPATDQDAKRRLGNFEGAGEHARQGGRTSGIVGQTKRKNKTDK